MLRSLIKLVLAGVFCITNSSPANSQTVTLGEPFPEILQGTRYLPLGSNGRFIYMAEVHPGANPRLLIYNDQLQLLKNQDKPELINYIPLSFTPAGEGMDLLYETFNNEYRVYKVFSERNGTISEKEMLRIPNGYTGAWKFTQSPSRNFFMLYNVDSSLTDSVAVNILLIDKDYEVIEGKKFTFYIQKLLEKFGNLYIDDSGNVYSMIFDQPLNYRLGTHLRIFKYLFEEEKIFRKEFYLKEKKLADIHISFSPGNNLVFLNSFYYDFYTKDINGIFCGMLNDKLEQRTTFSYFDFDKKFKKAFNVLGSGVTTNDLVNLIRMGNITVSDSGAYYMSALIETSELKPMIDFNSGQRFSSSGNNGINGATNVQQRDALIRNTMTPSRTGRGRFNGSPGTSQPVSYSEAFVNAISRRPDLFFMPDDTISNKRPEVPYLRKKIYDRQVIFSFNKELGLNWHRWFETEDQSLFRKNDLHPAETNASFATVYYRHNHKGNTELAITKISKPSGEMITQPLKVPEDITLFTTGPIYKLGENKIVMLYYSSKKRGTGLATIEW